MASIQPERNIVTMLHNVREVVREKSYLFGLWKKQEILNTTTIGYDLYIDTLQNPNHIYLNGKEITPQNIKEEIIHNKCNKPIEECQCADASVRVVSKELKFNIQGDE